MLGLMKDRAIRRQNKREILLNQRARARANHPAGKGRPDEPNLRVVR